MTISNSLCTISGSLKQLYPSAHNHITQPLYGRKKPMAHLVCVQLEAILEQLGSVILANVLPVSAMILKLVVYAYG